MYLFLAPVILELSLLTVSVFETVSFEYVLYIFTVYFPGLRFVAICATPFESVFTEYVLPLSY